MFSLKVLSYWNLNCHVAGSIGKKDALKVLSYWNLNKLKLKTV